MSLKIGLDNLKRNSMKKENLGYLLAGFAFFVMMSMTITDASKDLRFKATNGVMLSVPAKPIATVYVRGTDEMYKYIKKGYQVQDVVGGDNNQWHHSFLMVKY
jgi:hypothetical protein